MAVFFFLVDVTVTKILCGRKHFKQEFSQLMRAELKTVQKICNPVLVKALTRGKETKRKNS